MAVTQEGLTQIAAATRARLESEVWPRDPDRLSWPSQPLSYLQCAKSMPHLLDALHEAGINGIADPIRRHLGRLAFGPELGTVPIFPHQWLQVAQFAIDITADQRGATVSPVICGDVQELAEAGLFFQPHQTFVVQRDLGRWQQTPL